jgi:hypothetical protein
MNARLVRQWAAVAGAFFLVGLIAQGLISEADSHTGVGMGGFARLLLCGIAGGAAAVIGLVLAIFRKTRRFGLLLSAAGVGFFLGVLLGVVAVLL